MQAPQYDRILRQFSEQWSLGEAEWHTDSQGFSYSWFLSFGETFVAHVRVDFSRIGEGGLTDYMTVGCYLFGKHPDERFAEQIGTAMSKVSSDMVYARPVYDPTRELFGVRSVFLCEGLTTRQIVTRLELGLWLTVFNFPGLIRVMTEVMHHCDLCKKGEECPARQQEVKREEEPTGRTMRTIFGSKIPIPEG